jgi:hypothetical protein
MTAVSERQAVDAGLSRLLASDEPAIRHAALVELAGRPADDRVVAAARRAIPGGDLVRGLLETPDNAGRAIAPYSKWRGAHWRLVSLVDLGVPADAVPISSLVEPILSWLVGKYHRTNVARIEGRFRRCASVEGNAVASCSRLGLADDERVRVFASSLIEWQWPDGGWNCDRRPSATHSSFHETLPALLGLVEFAAETGDRDAAQAVDRGAEFLLRHRVVYSERTGELADPAFVRLRYPPYWHYDLLAALKVLGRAGRLGDDRAAPALELLAKKRAGDGTWATSGRWWRPPGSSSALVEVVDWGSSGPSAPLTLGALRVLKAAGRWDPWGGKP